MDAERRLILLRHAKSAYPHGVPDHDRPLAGRGRRNAQAAGRWLVGEGPPFGVALCSDATRARHTWEIVRSELERSRLRVETRIEPALYGAAPEDILDLLKDLPANLTGVIMIGREPTLSEATLGLAGPGSDPDSIRRVRDKFATSALAVLRWHGGWDQLGPGGAVLETYAKPRV